AAPVEAYPWYRKAADRGSGWGAYQVGACCGSGAKLPYEGGGPRAQTSQHGPWLKRAAAMGYFRAQREVAGWYAGGRPVTEGLAAGSQAEGLDWADRAAAQGDAVAAEQVGGAYAAGLGWGMTKDRGKALPWLKRAGEMGLPRAQALYGFYLAYG